MTMRSFGAVVTPVLLLAGSLHAQGSNELAGASWRAETAQAVTRALSWLAANQKPDGSWSNPNFPALTALPLQAFLRSDHPDRARVVPKAVGFLLANVQADGGIYRKSIIPGRGGLTTYNTAICMTALHATGDRALAPVVLRARTFVASSQDLGSGDSSGGFGYNRSGLMSGSDLLNTTEAVYAMRLTQDAEDLRPAGEKKADLDWDAVIRYVSKLQNNGAAGTNEAGGFYYRTGKSAAGTTNAPDGTVVFRSYGSMTYVGLLSLVYANVPRSDPRVLSAFDWSCRHWSLDENPGLGPQGMFFFYNVLSKSLAAYGASDIPRPTGTRIAWREELARKLLSLRRTDPESGLTFWVNESGRFWENDPALVTAYSVMALLLTQ